MDSVDSIDDPLGAVAGRQINTVVGVGNDGTVRVLNFHYMGSLLQELDYDPQDARELARLLREAADLLEG